MAGYDGVIVTGKADEPVYILVTDEGGEIKPAKHLWGTVGEETIKILNREVTADADEEEAARRPLEGARHHLHRPRGGEHGAQRRGDERRSATPAGYGGYGALMGSKNLKAIVAKGRGKIPDRRRPRGGQGSSGRRTHEHLIGQTRMRRWGTGYVGYAAGADTSSEPIRNWQEEWHDEKSMGGPKFENKFWVKKKWADFNCTTNCMKVSCIKNGQVEGRHHRHPRLRARRHTAGPTSASSTPPTTYT